MKKYFMYFIAVIFLVIPVIAVADYIETVNVYQYSASGTINWSHSYNNSVTPIYSATLTIVADDVDLGEQDAVWFNGHYLGYLNNMGYATDYTGPSLGAGNPDPTALTTTKFAIDPSWISANMTASVYVDSAWGVEIETSGIEIKGVPEPTTMLLLGFGIVGLAGLGRFKK
jgi:hypothetical protein